MAKRKRRRRRNPPASRQSRRNWSAAGVGTIVLVVALALIVGFARAM